MLLPEKGQGKVLEGTVVAVGPGLRDDKVGKSKKLFSTCKLGLTPPYDIIWMLQ